MIPYLEHTVNFEPPGGMIFLSSDNSEPFTKTFLSFSNVYQFPYEHLRHSCEETSNTANKRVAYDLVFGSGRPLSMSTEKFDFQ